VAEGLLARLAAVTVTDGSRCGPGRVPAAAGFVTDPRTGEPGVQVTLLGPGGAVVSDRHSDLATAMVGLDDDPDAVAAVRIRARLAADGPVEVGVLGAADWTARGRRRHHHVRPAHLRHRHRRGAAVPAGRGGCVPGRRRWSRRPRRCGRPPTARLRRRVRARRRPAPRPDAEVTAEAVAAARAADVAVVVVGLTEEQETEAVDKTTLRLPGGQDALIRAVAAAAPRTVVVGNAATPVLMPWLAEVSAVLWAGLPGQEGGHAVAAALTGDIEPAGRLVTTFPLADGRHARRGR
jgi:beta-glucosidase